MARNDVTHSKGDTYGTLMELASRLIDAHMPQPEAVRIARLAAAEAYAAMARVIKEEERKRLAPDDANPEYLDYLKGRGPDPRD